MRKSKNRVLTLLFTIVLMITVTDIYVSDEVRWLAVGSLHSWYSSAGCEIELGRTHQIPDQQDGLRWPAQYLYQDTEAAKGLWLGAKNYYDKRADKTFTYKVVHTGPRVLNEESEFMPVKFTLVGKFDHPRVYVDGVPAGKLDFMDFVDSVDANLPCDRLLIDKVNTSIGVTMLRKIYAFSQQYNDNYFIYDYTFTNTGIIDKNGTKNEQTLEDFMIFFQYRYAPTREGGPYGYYWLPQGTSWGQSTMNDFVFVDENNNPFRAQFSWLGKHSAAGYDNIGGPNVGTASYFADGRLGAAQFDGVIVIHADTSPTDTTDDLNQPYTTKEVDSDGNINYNNDQFNEQQMTEEYAAMTAGRPPLSMAQQVGDGYADQYGNTAGGFSQGQGFGPYQLAPGESIHIVVAEGVAGLCRDSCYTIGARWLEGKGPFVLPDGSSTNDKDVYKDAWVMTGKDSLFQTFRRAMAAYKNNFQIPTPPPPPDEFIVTSGGDRINLKWTKNAESYPHFMGYRIYRAINVPDTTYDLIYECGPGTNNPLVTSGKYNTWNDTSLARGFDYYYYITSFDDGSTNNIQPGVPLESSKFYTMTNNPANLKRPPGTELSQIRIVPNPYNIRSKDLQFGDSGPDRIMFYNIPGECTIRIYTERGDLIKTIEHNNGTGDEAWNSVTSYRQVVVSGIYIAVISTPDGQQVIKKFVIIR